MTTVRATAATHDTGRQSGSRCSGRLRAVAAGLTHQWRLLETEWQRRPIRIGIYMAWRRSASELTGGDYRRQGR